jgi:hypothetical protein
MKNIFVISLFFAFLSWCVSVYAAGAPSIFSYQGRLADSNGDLLGGSGTTYYFKFSIWDNATVGSGSRLWPSSAPSATSATVREGVFNVNIGDTDNGYPDALNLDFNTDSDIYLQVEVSSDNITFEILSPRQRIASAVFSQLSGAVSGTGQSSFGTTTPFSGAVVTVEATSTSAIPLVIRSLASQVADLFRIISSTGSKLFTFTAGGDAEINDGNLWACAGGSCEASDPGTSGNVIVDTSFIFGNGFYLKQTSDSTTTLYDPTDTAIIEFDTGQ